MAQASVQGEEGKPRPSATDRRRGRVAALVFVIVAALVVGLNVAAVAVRRPQARLTVVNIAGDQAFFNDQAVKDELASRGYQVHQDAAGSQDVPSVPKLAQNYDIANVGSSAERAKVESILDKSGLPHDHYNIFTSPMVIVTYKKIVQLLTSSPERIATTAENGKVVIFNVAKYLDAVGRKLLWNQLGGNVSYPNPNRFLLVTTDPEHSNSGGMFAAMASAALNNRQVIGGLHQGETIDQIPGLRTVTPQGPSELVDSFRAQGIKETHTPDLLDRFLTGGIDSSYPMVLVYEGDFIHTMLSGQDIKSRNDLALMYPDPLVQADNQLISWTQVGQDFVNVLKQDTKLRAPEERYGYRVSNNFVADMAARHIVVPDFSGDRPPVYPIGLPSYDDLDILIKAIHG